jgi:hypothetical protein
MAPRIRKPGGAAAPLARRPADPALRLQGAIGNRALGQVLARKPASAPSQGTVQIGKLPAITIVGGNAGEWAAKKDPDALEISSKKGKHSAELEKLASARTRVATLKVVVPKDPSGQHLDYGSVEITFGNARITGYSVDGDTETWRAVDFDTVNRTTITRHSGI